MEKKSTIYGLIVVAILSTVSIPSYSIEIRNDRDTVLVLGEEMSELRYMLEVFALIGTDVKYKAPKNRLKDSIEEYEKRIKKLQDRYQKGEISDSLDRVLKAWLRVKGDLIKAFNKDISEEEMERRAIDIHSKIRSVIKELEYIKNIIVQKSHLSNIKELNAAIEISSSIRRISSHYMMKMWNLDDPTIYQHWDKGLEIYKNSLDILQRSEFAENDKFATLLDLVKRKHNLFLILRRMSINNKFTPVLIQEHTAKASKAARKMIRMILDKN